jgi:hypothetical protein
MAGADETSAHSGLDDREKASRHKLLLNLVPN